MRHRGGRRSRRGFYPGPRAPGVPGVASAARVYRVRRRATRRRRPGRHTSAARRAVGLRSFHRRRRRAPERPCRHGPWSRYNEINVSGESAYRSMVDRAVPRGRVPFRRRWTPALREPCGTPPDAAAPALVPPGPGAIVPRVRVCPHRSRSPCDGGRDGMLDVAEPWGARRALVRDIERRSKDDLALTSVSLVLR